MEAIWKFPLAMINEQEIEIPQGYVPLCIMLQNEMPVLWCRVNVTHSEQRVKIRTYATGHPITHVAEKYVGSYQILRSGGNLVFHVFIAEYTQYRT